MVSQHPLAIQDIVGYGAPVGAMFFFRKLKATRSYIEEILYLLEGICHAVLLHTKPTLGFLFEKKNQASTVILILCLTAQYHFCLDYIQKSLVAFAIFFTCHLISSI